MSNIAMYKGGMANTLFPGDFGQERFTLPYPARVAGEYDRGHFTLGFMFHPAARGAQAEKLAAAAVNDLVEVLVVPSEHVITSVFVDVNPNPPRVSGMCGGHPGSMAGVTFDVVAEFRDNTTDAVVSTLALPAALAGLDANVAASYQGFIQRYVPRGQTLVISLKLLTAPTDATLKFADMGGSIATVAKVQDYQFPMVS